MAAVVSAGSVWWAGGGARQCRTRGGPLLVAPACPNITLTHLTFINSHAGVSPLISSQPYQYCDRLITMDSVIFNNSASTFFAYSNSDAFLSNVTVTRCSSATGALHLGDGANLYAQFLTVDNARGIFADLGQSTTHIYISNSTFHSSSLVVLSETQSPESELVLSMNQFLAVEGTDAAVNTSLPTVLDQCGFVYGRTSLTVGHPRTPFPVPINITGSQFRYASEQAVLLLAGAAAVLTQCDILFNFTTPPQGQWPVAITVANATLALHSSVIAAALIGVKCNGSATITHTRFVDTETKITCENCHIENTYNYCHWPLGLNTLQFSLWLVVLLTTPFVCVIYCRWSIKRYSDLEPDM